MSEAHENMNKAFLQDSVQCKCIVIRDQQKNGVVSELRIVYPSKPQVPRNERQRYPDTIVSAESSQKECGIGNFCAICHFSTKSPFRKERK